VGGWLCAVALRLAKNARSCTTRNRQREMALVEGGPGINGPPLYNQDPAHVGPLADVARRELRQVLDDELGRLPEKYRAPLVLCYLEGKTNEEAAHQLGWPAGSMSRRLERARGMLRPRLARRGLSLPVLLFCIGLAALGSWTAAFKHRGNPGPIRAAMTPFKPSEEGGEGLEVDLARIAGADKSALEWNVLARLARHSARVAKEIKKLEPGNKAEQWRCLVEEMRAAAEGLAGAVQQSDDNAARDAARRLNASCVKCHVAFRD